MADNDDSKSAPQTSPRGTDRVRRRSTQKTHAEQAINEAAKLVSPNTPEKAERIKQAKVEQAKVGEKPGGVRKVKQERNRERAATEITTIQTQPVTAPLLTPGAQVDLQTANRMARANSLEEKDYIVSAAQAAGLAVRQRLSGQPLRGRHNRSRYIAQHNARVAAAEAAQQKE